jgi:hypothetical protein
MPNVTGNLSEQIQTTLDIDYIGKRYSIFRGENESLYNFKERIISALTIPGDETELGYSVAIARAFNCVPKVIGYISLENGIYVKSDGNRIIVGTTATNEVFVIESTENYNIKDFKEYLEDNMFGTINLIEDKYLYKNVCFLLPFRNHYLYTDIIFEAFKNTSDEKRATIRKLKKENEEKFYSSSNNLNPLSLDTVSPTFLYKKDMTKLKSDYLRQLDNQYLNNNLNKIIKSECQ